MVWCSNCATHINPLSYEETKLCCTLCGRVLAEDIYMSDSEESAARKRERGDKGHCRTMIFYDDTGPLVNANPIRWNRSIQNRSIQANPEPAEELEIPIGVANGTSSRTSSSRVSPPWMEDSQDFPSSTENTDDDTNLSEIKFPISSPSEVSTSVDRKRKRPEFVTGAHQPKPKKTTEDKILECLERILDIMQRETVSSRTFGNGVQFSIRDCLNALVRIPQIKEGDALFLYATRLFLKPDIRELFICLDKDEIRLKWLQDELNRDEQTNAFSF